MFLLSSEVSFASLDSTSKTSGHPPGCVIALLHNDAIALAWYKMKDEKDTKF